MDYTYYPGCSLSATGHAYDASTRAISGKLGLNLIELDDWNCCGATAYMSVEELTSMSLSARNLAMAEKFGRDVVAPCSACYTVLRKTHEYMSEYPELREKVNLALNAGGLKYDCSLRVRHLLQVLVEDVGYEKLREATVRPLSGLKLACYYGCQIVRPKGAFDDPEHPQTLDKLVEAIGATPTHFPYKAKCCGGTLMWTKSDAGLELTKNILTSAVQFGADAVVTTCPLCQTNLEVYQGKIRRKFNADVDIPIVYFTQLIGLALGIDPKTLELDKLAVSTDRLTARFA